MTRPLLSSIVAIAIIVSSANCIADDPSTGSADLAVAHGLEFLAAGQNSDGSFGATQKPAVTSVALLAFLSCGHMPNAGRFEASAGKYGSTVRNAIDYLLAQAQPDGSFGKQERSMFTQAVATLALSMAYGVDQNAGQRKKTATVLALAVKFIAAQQDFKKTDAGSGGWRADANAADSDLSVTCLNLMALRAAQEAAIPAQRSAALRAARFVTRCYNAEAKVFSNQPGAAPNPEATAAGAIALRLIDPARSELSAIQPTSDSGDDDQESSVNYLGGYLLSLFSLGVDLDHEQRIFSPVAARLVKLAQADGGWPESAGNLVAGRMYCTSLAILTLSAPNRLLPIDLR